MRALTMEDAKRALQDAIRHGDDDVRVDMQPVRQAAPAVRLETPTMSEAFSALEEAQYRSLAHDLGIEPGEPEKMVRVDAAELAALRAQAATVTDHLKQRPANTSPEEEREYQEFAKAFGF